MVNYAVHITSCASSTKEGKMAKATYGVWRIFWAHSRAVEQKTDGGRLLSLALTEGIHEFFQLRRALDLEKDLIMIVGDLDVQVLNRFGLNIRS